MKRRINKKTSIHEYLEKSKVLENGTDEEIARVKKEYWRKYKAAWRREKRRAEKELTTYWNKDELKTLKQAAKKHKRSKTSFIKTATLAYIDKRYVVPDALEVRRIAQLLAMIYNSIREMMEENALNLQIGKLISEKLFELEREVLVSLHNPKTIEELIIEAIKKDADAKADFFKLLESIP